MSCDTMQGVQHCFNHSSAGKGGDEQTSAKCFANHLPRIASLTVSSIVCIVWPSAIVVQTDGEDLPPSR